MRTFFATLALVFAASAVHADPLNCSLARYTPAPGLTVAVAGDTVALTWDGDRDQEVRLQFAIAGGTPTIRELAIRRKGARPWVTVASNLIPEFRVVAGVRRINTQQLDMLRYLGVEITPDIIEREQWHVFDDAPLFIPGFEKGREDRNLGLPRKPEEIKRATATYRAQSCAVTTDGARLEISFPGLQLGVFAGRLQYTVYKGTNLIRQEAIARTDEPSVAYKYDSGLKGLAIQPASRMVWRDLARNWQEYGFGGATNENLVALKASNRVVIAEGPGGSIAAFPPPHTFFWARQVETNLGYTWYRKDSSATFAFGIRQAEEEVEQYEANFALYNARPGTWQRMAAYFYVSAEPAQAALESVLAFTHGDHYKPLPGYQTLAHHYHTRIAERLLQAGDLDIRLPDLDAMRAAGITIPSPADFHGDGHPWDPGPLRLKNQAAYFEAVRRHSDRNFLIMPGEEVDCGNVRQPCPFGAYLGAHWDVLYSKPVFWTRVRAPGQPFVEEDPTYGRVYHVGSAEDVMEMVSRENALIFMPHPRTKGSTGYPDAIKDTAYFRDERYRGIGWRWGMGLDLSEQRLSDLRVLPLLDEMNNWVADLPTPPKYLLAITETRFKGPGDDVYGMSPVNYVKVDPLPRPDDMSPVIAALKRGDFFATTGEVLIPSYTLQGTGTQLTVVADVEWTFPLEFVEVVWGDGSTTDRQIISATHLPAFGRHQFKIPFDATGKKWMRFAVWDSAGNGALVQPVKLPRERATTAR